MHGALPHQNKFETHFILANFSAITYLASGKNAPFFPDKGKSGVLPQLLVNDDLFLISSTQYQWLALGKFWRCDEKERGSRWTSDFSVNVFISLEKQWSLPEKDNLYFLLCAGKASCLFHASYLL